MTDLHQGPDEAYAPRPLDRPLDRPLVPSHRAHPSDPSGPEGPPGAADDSADDSSSSGRGRHAIGDSRGFDGVIGWTVLGSVVPGLGLLVAGRRRSGQVLLVVTAVLVAAAVAAADLVDPVATGRRLLTAPDRFVVAAAVLVALVAVWAVLVVVTHVALRRAAAGAGAPLTRPQSAVGGVLVTALVVALSVPAGYVAVDALAARDALKSVFGDPARQLAGGQVPHVAQADPWAGVTRVNVLLIGSDAGADRTGVRPDTLIVASIDPHTGDAVLVSLPRNLQRVPFPAGSGGARDYPDGFQCVNPRSGSNTECLLNALWVWGEGHPQYYPGDNHPGLTATIQGVQEATGLTLDQYVMLNLAGFEQVVDILGGLTVNVQERLPIGGNVEHPVASAWLEPGRQKLNGHLALWYARSRWSTTDFDRMRRQRCVIGDFVDQIDPVTVALRFPQIASSAKQNLQTSIPLADLDAWATLAAKVKGTHLRSLAFTDQVINTVRPDYARMHQLVQEALVPPAPRPSTSASASGPSSTPTPTPSRTASSGSPSSSAAAGAVQDVAAVC